MCIRDSTNTITNTDTTTTTNTNTNTTTTTDTLHHQVIESYSCALYSGGLPVHGRLYITASHALFSGWRNTKVTKGGATQWAMAVFIERRYDGINLIIK